MIKTLGLPNHTKLCENANSSLKKKTLLVTPQIRDVTGQRQTYTYASEALTY